MNLENKTLKSAAEIAAEGKTELESNLDEKTPDNNISSEEIKANEVYDETVKKEDAKNLTSLRESMGLEQVTQDINSETSAEEEKGIENTSGFQEAIASGDTAKAEAWLKENSNNENYDARWLDHRSRDLFRTYRDSGDFAGAQRMIDILPDGEGKEGRTKNLNEVINKANSETSAEEEKGIENTSGFQEAINAGDLEAAKKFLLDNLENENYDARWTDHRSRELFKAARQNEDWSLAKQMVELGNGAEAVNGRREVLEKESGLDIDQI